MRDSRSSDRPPDALIRHLADLLSLPYRPEGSAPRPSRAGELYQVQLGEQFFALKLYADDNDGLYTPRTNSYRWPTLLCEYYRTTNLLICSTDALRGTPQTSTTSPSPQDRCPRRNRPMVWVVLGGRKRSLPPLFPGEVAHDPAFEVLLLFDIDEALDNAESGRPLAEDQTTVLIAACRHCFRPDGRSSGASPKDRILPPDNRHC